MRCIPANIRTSTSPVGSLRFDISLAFGSANIEPQTSSRLGLGPYIRGIHLISMVYIIHIYIYIYPYTIVECTAVWGLPELLGRHQGSTGPCCRGNTSCNAVQQSCKLTTAIELRTGNGTITFRLQLASMQ